jgi:protein MAK11
MSLIISDVRVKAIDTLRISVPSSSNEIESTTTILASASSDGKIHVYDLAQLSTDIVSRLKGEGPVQQLAPIALYDTKGTRLTCLTLADGGVSRLNVFVGDKRKAPMGEAESEEDNEGDRTSDESEGDEETKLDSDAQA